MAVKKGPLSLLIPSESTISADRLEYPDLEESVRTYYWDEYVQLGGDVDMSDPETVQIDTSSMNERHLALIALKLQQTDNRSEQQSWSNLFTDVSVNLYGRPDEAEALSIIKNDLVTFEELDHPRRGFSGKAVGKVLDLYQDISQRTPDNLARLHDDDEVLLAAVDDYLESKYGHVYEVFSDLDKYDIIGVDEIIRRFERVIDILAIDDPAWNEWTIVPTNSAQMAVSPSKQEIRIGRNLPDLPVHRVRGLLSHEIFRHVGSGVAGREYSEELGVGLPGNKKAEEGIGMIYEGAKERKVPYRAGDRYVDVALGLGLADQPPLSRPDMFPLVYGRTILRRTADRAPIDDGMVTDISWQHINRIYRGTLGNDVVGVFTRDAQRYYEGYRDMAYLLKQYPLQYLPYALDFIGSGKIDPSQSGHRRHLDDHINGHHEQIWPKIKAD